MQRKGQGEGGGEGHAQGEPPAAMRSTWTGPEHMLRETPDTQATRLTLLLGRVPSRRSLRQVVGWWEPRGGAVLPGTGCFGGWNVLELDNGSGCTAL